ncbi:trehalose-6-phosphate synthase, fragment [Ectocarpus siliculosus]|uniref:Trehalose-6-phosphate synthase n=1 Tax=Ectocarpus siliculosus TaxID=2880 RepID=D7FT12_ECTSI|nr:trehalose-6-phosphate synthase, fragment [Ectocarpus siliculosus]
MRLLAPTLLSRRCGSFLCVDVGRFSFNEGGNPNNVVWVDDHHLMLLPKLLNDREEDAAQHGQTSTIVVLHIPFPVSQIFRALPGTW